MIDLQKGFDIASRNVLTKYVHPHWKRTVELARQYKALITGEGLEFMLRRFDRRESQEDFEQANRIAQQITPAITAALMNPARRLGGVKPVVDRLDYGKENDPKADELDKGIETFSGGLGVDKYLSSLVDPSDADPNAFAVLTFDDFDERYEKPQVFPVIVPCENVLDAPRPNNELQYLWLGFDIEYIVDPAKYNADGTIQTKATTAKGRRFVLYIDNHHIIFEQVKNRTGVFPVVGVLYGEGDQPIEISKDKGVTFSTGKEKAVYYFRGGKEELYQVTFYEQKSGRVPCFALGCKPDPYTGGLTFVNRWHDALPHLKKSLKHVRELDLSIALHTFPQKIQYISKCRAIGCNGGYMPGGDECGTCKGAGFQTITTAQDHITLPMPKTKDEMFDPTQIIHYAEVPIDIVTKLMEIVKDDRSDAFRAVYGFDLFGDGRVGKTVEEVLAMNQAMYDALAPLALWREHTRTTIVWVYASYNDMDEGLNVVYKYPRDFGFETSAQILALMERATTAGASTSYRANLNLKLTTSTFSDDEIALARVKTQTRFDPYPGKTEATILALISGGQTLDRSAIRWTESETIFAKCEETSTGPVSFYQLADSKQQVIYDKVVDEMLEEIDAKKQAAMLPLTGMEEEIDPVTGEPKEPVVPPLE